MRLRSALRPPLAAMLWPAVKPFRLTVERTRAGAPVRPGITAVVAARDEAYTIPFALRSLIGVADQIVCIDNGSTDATLVRMQSFKEEHNAELDVDILSMPDALLGDCREAGLDRTRRQWHLRWDADMVAAANGPNSILSVRQAVLSNSRPRTIQLSRTNLYGDLRHTWRIGQVIDPGEPILMRFGRGIAYREHGKFDTVRVPLHYLQERASGRHIFHLAGLKSDENLIHRFHYFAWRDAFNREGDALHPELRTLEGFKRRRNLELFGTDDPRAVKFRYGRQLAYHYVRYDPHRFGDYPEVLRDELTRPQRFEVIYRDGRPWTRIDHEDTEMLDYEPNAEDLEWDPEAFLRRFLGADECRILGIVPT